jgi:phage recombination protein Bet
MSNDLAIIDQPENRKLLKETICKGATESEFHVFIYACKRLGLDPFAKQIYMVKRGEGAMTIQTGVDGFRLIADRTGRYAPGKPSEFEYKDGRLFAATSFIMKQTSDGTWHEVAHTAHFSEYAAYTKSGDLNTFWKRMPCVMLAKCLPYHARIQTNLGVFSIGDIVNKKMKVSVRSINLITGIEEWKPIVNWIKNGGTQYWQRIVAPNLTHGNRPITTTPDHLIYTKSGWKEARKIKVGEEIAVASPLPSPDQNQILLGSLLGDGTLASQKGRNGCTYFSEAHSEKQSEYLLWKSKNLSTFNPTIFTYKVKVKGCNYDVVKMTTKSCSYFYNLRKDFYKDGKKIVSKDILNQLNDLGVAIWFMDDGNFKKTGVSEGCNPIIRLYTCCFENQEIIIDFFEKKYNVRPKILRKEKNPYISFDVQDTKIILDSLSDYLIFDYESNTKKWIAKDVNQGVSSFSFVPCLKNEIYDRGEKEGKYDITVMDNHNFFYNNVLVHNCAETAALRKAFPSELSGIYSAEEMQQADNPSVASFGVYESTQWLQEKCKTLNESDLLEYISEVAKHYELDNNKVIEELAKDDEKFNANFTKWKERKTQKDVIEVDKKSS